MVVFRETRSCNPLSTCIEVVVKAVDVVGDKVRVVGTILVVLDVLVVVWLQPIINSKIAANNKDNDNFSNFIITQSPPGHHNRIVSTLPVR